MKHAGPRALDVLEPLLGELRKLEGLTEKSRGVFYRRGKAWLHFHEDPKGLYADLRPSEGADFERLKVDDDAARAELVARARAALAPDPFARNRCDR